METEEIVRCYGRMRGEIMGENRKIYAALLGAGTVGSGVYKLAGMQEEDICLKTGAQLEIKKILVRNPGKVREGIPQELFTDSWQEILEDSEIQIVIEVMGGIEPARTYVEEAMKAGMPQARAAISSGSRERWIPEATRYTPSPARNHTRKRDIISGDSGRDFLRPDISPFLTVPGTDASW